MKAPSYNPEWPDEVKALYQHDMEQYWDKTLSPNQWNQYQSMLKQLTSITNNVSGLRILDVGCAQATLPLLLAEQGHCVTAIDLRQNSLDYAASRFEFGDIEFIQGNVLDLHLETRFDLIYANQIIEHLVYPRQMLSCLKTLLNPGGRLVVSTPNHGYLVSKHPTFTQLGDPKEWEHKQFTADGSGHFFAYTKAELIDLFKASKLKKIEVRVCETPFISGHMKLRYLHKILPYRVLSALDRLILRIPFLRNCLGHQLIVIGERS